MTVNLTLKPWLLQLRLDSIVVTFWGIFPAPSDTSFSVNLSHDKEGAGAMAAILCSEASCLQLPTSHLHPLVSADPTVDP